MAAPERQDYSSSSDPYIRLVYSQEANSTLRSAVSAANSAPAVKYYANTTHLSKLAMGDGMAASDDLIDAKIARASAEADTKIARMEGKIDTLSATILGELRGVRDDIRDADQYNRGTRWALIGVIVTSAFALAALGLGLVTYGDAIFGRGMNVRDVVQSAVKDVYDQSKKDSSK